ncbi:MAG: hypothetical protein PUH13_08015 [Treponema sp.]|nr:hypothetical protein [Treponema sp.]
MQVCKLISGLAGLVLCSAVYAQSISNPEMPAMPAMPGMPSLETPFYTPSFPSNSVVPKKKSNKNETTETEKQSVITNNDNADDIVSTLMNNSSILSASDITSLYDSGMFNNLSSLSGTTAASSTNVLLQQVLTSLEELKTQQKNASPVQRQQLENAQEDSQIFKQREPQILRFRINGYDIKDSLTTVFFSEPEADGTFLLTGDRRYFTNQKSRTETFYLMFKAVKSNGSVTTFDVQPSIVQDALNENSFVYKFSKIKNLKAEKTGNLVVLHADDGLKVDLLLDIDK